MVTIIVGEGPNNVEIPLRVMETPEDAHEFLETIPGLSRKGDRYAVADHLSEGGEDESEPFYGLFREQRYYAGCGGCYYISVREVNFNEPLVMWDLD